jgi:hypothetical protein
VSDTLETVKQLVAAGDLRISEHGFDELSEDDISVRDVLSGIETSILVEDYPSYPKGPSVLVLQFDSDNRPVHVVWGIPKGFKSPAVLVTAYRPDPARWNENFTERRQ